MSNLFKILSLIFLINGVSFSQYGEWELAGDMPYPVTRATAVTYNSMIYVIGGYSDSLQANVKWIQKYNPDSGSWNIAAKMQIGRAGFQADVYKDMLFIYGGVDEDSDSAYSLERWNFIDTTTVVHSTNEFFDRVYSTGVVNDTSLVIIGGYAGSIGVPTYLPYILKYNFPSDTFSVIDDESYQTDELPIQQMGVKVDNLFYLFGGAYNGVLQNFDLLDLSTYQLNHIENREISPRAAGAAVYLEDYRMILLIGGYTERLPSTPSVEIIRPLTEQSVINEEGPYLNFSRKNPCAVYLEGSIFVFGGEQGNGKLIKAIEKLSWSVTAADETENRRAEFKLHQNYPNPFNPATKIGYSLDRGKYVSIDIYNVLGERVIRLFDGHSPAGSHELNWNGKNTNGEEQPSGIYFYSMKTDTKQITKKMLLLR